MARVVKPDTSTEKLIAAAIEGVAHAESKDKCAKQEDNVL
jgi:hypothetical protein